MTATFHVKQRITKAKKPRGKVPSNRKTSDTYKRQMALSKQMGNAMTLNLVDGIKAFKKRIKDSTLMEAWRMGEYTSLLNHIPWHRLPEDLEPAFQDIKTSSFKGGTVALKALPPNPNKSLRFDLSNPAINRYMHKRAGEMIKYIGDDARTTVRMAIQQSFSKALSPREVAARIKGSIGLLPRHVTAVVNFRDNLLQQNLPTARIDRMAADYEERLLNYRARLIARSETRMAVNEGQLEVWREGKDQGLMAPNSGKMWVKDGNPCDICTDMDGEVVGVDESWIIDYPDGSSKSVDTPSESHPQCECGMELVFGDEAT